MPHIKCVLGDNPCRICIGAHDPSDKSHTGGTKNARGNPNGLVIKTHEDGAQTLVFSDPPFEICIAESFSLGSAHS